MKFKVFLPTGYQIEKEDNDNLDINVILENGEIFFCTIFTIKNIDFLMKKNLLSFFWADNMVIIKDLSKRSILEFVKEALELDNFKIIFFKIGELGKTEGYDFLFDEINDF
ncbi:hypothetical protein DI487_14165 [Flavobacterium sediminis]|uniref:Uncharacterized protein n=1 Tax=Flavobacterium sediminis TaxID=2201181 RepID=A0A2U8QY96_9FLAO|nr:hypothetical protein [Flavobacterium sediminis]AWM14886.1 hypothetical protein DI487_14165 [Flavobacterium sediminis]